MSSAIETRVLTTIDDLQLVQKLEKTVWNMEPLALHQTITASQNGGLIIGAFLNEEMIGFSYSFAGFKKGLSYLCSHMLGIHPNHQEKGIGARLKEEQKEIARKMGYDLIVWTYDPLETRNGYLNLSKLHALCATYMENYYGEMKDILNSDLPSDRFKVEWWINSDPVVKKKEYDKHQARSFFQWEKTEEDLPKLMGVEAGLQRTLDSERTVFVPVPADFQSLKNSCIDLAIDWRLKTRKIFKHLFAKGFAVVSLIKSNDEPVHYYLLERMVDIEMNNYHRTEVKK